VIEYLNQAFEKVRFSRTILAYEDVDEAVSFEGDGEVAKVFVSADPN
jgi:hypothetical protein